MGVFSRTCACVVLAAGSVFASTYVVGNESGHDIVAEPGGSILGNSGSSLYDMTLDASGNFIVAGLNLLQKVTPGGAALVTTTIATIPISGQWVSAAADGLGNFIAADNANHVIWRISPSGSSIAQVAAYPICTTNSLEDVRVRVNGAGNYVIMHDNCSTVQIYVMTPGGSVTQTTLSTTIADDLGGFTFDGSGNYVVADLGSSTIYKVTPGGAVSTIASGGMLSSGLIGIAYDPASGNFVAINRSNNSLLQITPAGVVTTIASGSPMNGSIAVLVLVSPLTSTPAPSSLLLALLGIAAISGRALWRNRTA